MKTRIPPPSSDSAISLLILPDYLPNMIIAMLNRTPADEQTAKAFFDKAGYSVFSLTDLIAGEAAAENIPPEQYADEQCFRCGNGYFARMLSGRNPLLAVGDDFVAGVNNDQELAHFASMVPHFYVLDILRPEEVDKSINSPADIILVSCGSSEALEKKLSAAVHGLVEKAEQNTTVLPACKDAEVFGHRFYLKPKDNHMGYQIIDGAILQPSC
jgi:hypothetical protein